MGLRLPHRTTAGTIAALPWALVILAFSLWLSMLRHSRSAAAAPSAAAGPAVPDETPGPTLALAAGPAARAALPAPEPDPATQPSINNVEGLVPENPPPAEATADDGPDDRPAGTGNPADRANHANDHGDTGDDEVLGDQEAEAEGPGGPHPSDADTPPYGFPAVTGHAAGNGQAPANGQVAGDGAGATAAPTRDDAGTAPAARTPTLLSAPVPADVAAAPESEPAAPEPEPEPEDVAAKGRPPAASPGLSGAEAELAHEDHPSDDQEQQKKPAVPFERVRSTPTPPGE
jgi:hypothetical protein